MIRKLLPTLALFLTTLFCQAQNTQYDIQWQNTIGGSDYEYLNSITPTPDGGYVLGGTSLPTSVSSLTFIKYLPTSILFCILKHTYQKLLLNGIRISEDSDVDESF